MVCRNWMANGEFVEEGATIDAQIQSMRVPEVARAGGILRCRVIVDRLSVAGLEHDSRVEESNNLERTWIVIP